MFIDAHISEGELGFIENDVDAIHQHWVAATHLYLATIVVISVEYLVLGNKALHFIFHGHHLMRTYTLFA